MQAGHTALLGERMGRQVAAGAADAAATSEPGSARWVRSGGLGLWSRTAGLGRQGAWKSKGG